MTDTSCMQVGKAWNRRVSPYTHNIYALYADDQALTGWFLLITDPVIAKGVNDAKCVAVNLEDWIKLKELGAVTVTPFRVVAKGRGLIEKGFMPHTGLKYAVREVEGTSMMLIPIEDFKSV